MPIASIAFVIVSNTPGHTGWIPQFIGLAAFVIQFRHYPVSIPLPRQLKLACAMTLSLLMAVQWGAVIYWQSIIDAETTRCIGEFLENPDRPVSSPIHRTHQELPLYLMHKVDPSPLPSPWSQDVMMKTYGHTVIFSDEAR